MQCSCVALMDIVESFILMLPLHRDTNNIQHPVASQQSFDLDLFPQILLRCKFVEQRVLVTHVQLPWKNNGVPSSLWITH